MDSGFGERERDFLSDTGLTVSNSDEDDEDDATPPCSCFEGRVRVVEVIARRSVDDRVRGFSLQQAKHE